jgi:hypothetical protein
MTLPHDDLGRRPACPPPAPIWEVGAQFLKPVFLSLSLLSDSLLERPLPKLVLQNIGPIFGNLIKLFHVLVLRAKMKHWSVPQGWSFSVRRVGL